MALCTSEYVSISSEIMWADFRDTHALYFSRAGRFVGFNQDGFLLLGQEGLHLIGGYWFLQEDPVAIQKFKELPATELELKLIK